MYMYRLARAGTFSCELLVLCCLMFSTALSISSCVMGSLQDVYATWLMSGTICTHT